MKMLKQRNDSIEAFKKANRTDLVQVTSRFLFPKKNLFQE